jgi:hypothetical protein
MMSDKNLAELYRIFPIAIKLTDQKLAAQIANVWAKTFALSKWEKLEDACFSPDIQEKVTLVAHVNVVAEGAWHLSHLIEKYQGETFNYERLLALCLLHDVSKLLEYEPDGKGGYQRSEYGQKLQHGYMGAVIAREEGMDIDTQHLILTHTPQSKFQPLYKESILFSYVDLCDADMIFAARKMPLFFK